MIPDSLPSKLASPSLAGQESNWPVTPPFRPEKPYLTVAINGQWQMIPSLTNQKFNRRLGKPSLGGDLDKTLPVNKEKVILPYLTWRQSLKNVSEKKVSALPMTETKTLPITITSPIIINHLLDEETSLIVKPILESLGKEKLTDQKPFGEALLSYKEQIEKLMQKNVSLNQEVGKTKGELENLRGQLKNLEEENGQEPQLSEKAQKIKDSLIRIDQLIDDLGRKIDEGEKGINAFLQESRQNLSALEEVQAEKKANEAIITNLKQALFNEQQELNSLSQKGGMNAELAVKLSQIENLSKKLKSKEEENASIQKHLREAALQKERVDELGRELESFQKQINDLNQKKGSLTQTLEKTETELTTAKKNQERLEVENRERQEKIETQEKALNQLTQEKEKLTSFAQELAQKLTDLKARQTFEEVLEPKTKEPKGPTKVSVIRLKESALKLPSLTNLPNSINGVVRDDQGQLVQNAVVIVKDPNDHPIRALSTNGLGQFILTTPLSSGTYRLEIIKNNLSFDIMELELTGKVLGAVEITAKP